MFGSVSHFRENILIETYYELGGEKFSPAKHSFFNEQKHLVF